MNLKIIQLYKKFILRLIKIEFVLIELKLKSTFFKINQIDFVKLKIISKASWSSIDWTWTKSNWLNEVKLEIIWNSNQI